jgi:hypothetical protein
LNKAEALIVVGAIREYFKERGHEVSLEDWKRGLNDHNHEGMSEGDWSLAYEGGGLPEEWAYEVSGSHEVCAAAGNEGLVVMLEPRNHVILGIIDDRRLGWARAGRPSFEG